MPQTHVMTIAIDHSIPSHSLPSLPAPLTCGSPFFLPPSIVAAVAFPHALVVDLPFPPNSLVAVVDAQAATEVEVLQLEALSVDLADEVNHDHGGVTEHADLRSREGGARGVE